MDVPLANIMERYTIDIAWDAPVAARIRTLPGGQGVVERLEDRKFHFSGVVLIDFRPNPSKNYSV
jgi:hypothetical protein